ncbi:CPXCG motif-containing cysteine-rich protein [Persicimonas caeni]|uniref:CPXCG motif-containing cysteine-rich protein n=1 Tax=Persicimonas caeni TaxID=2292766 RepID=A0A4Y6PLY3_PERCE|nr:CPXCG motif-containing cysteine-rich protein [Persicimonas caeni]QDG49334.1 CPXCG motif-containing cysteine-rich protein [Persicimonas caeni]QED30555.1 CPXCG motif-containing cysteine-rich protein [Persicimonas caeni]
MQTTLTVQCPWCFERLELWVDPYTAGEFVRDCDVCCRPWRVFVARDASGRLQVNVQRSG